MPISRLCAWLGAALLCCFLSACSLVKLKEESAIFYSSTVLAGHVSSDAGWQHPVVVAAYSRQGGKLHIAHYAYLHEAGSYELIVPKGEYALFAFGDANGNLTLDPGEPVGDYAALPVRASGRGALINLDFVISTKEAGLLPRGTSVAAPTPQSLHSTQIGALASLDDPLFSADSGRRAYWAPVDFFRQAGGNVYFLEPYDPAKTPVLFVHGAAGSPQDWKYFIGKLDRRRYQPWIFYYPSGASLDSMSYLLYWKLINLQRRYHPERIYLTAHSMGGLLSRSFLATYGEQFPSIKLFVSLSTPWGGDALAERGVQYSPAVIPSWQDVRAGGRFVQGLYDKPLPRGLDYYLFFGHGGHYSLLRPDSNDGTITMASQLRPAAQAEARRLFGYGADHAGILSSPEAFAQYAALLKEADGKDSAAGSARGGSVKLAFSQAADSTVAASQPELILMPTEPGREAIVVPVGGHDSGRTLGPFPPGSYRAGLVARSFKSTPVARTLTITAGEVAGLDFVLSPDGALSGYIGARLAPADNPAGSFRAARHDIVIESIVLSGSDVRRELHPAAETQDRSLAALLDGRDYAFGSFFSFVGLKEGQYELIIKASGYPPYRELHTVVPGKYGYLTPIDLDRKK